MTGPELTDRGERTTTQGQGFRGGLPSISTAPSSLDTPMPPFSRDGVYFVAPNCLHHAENPAEKALSSIDTAPLHH